MTEDKTTESCEKCFYEPKCRAERQRLVLCDSYLNGGKWSEEDVRRAKAQGKLLFDRLCR
jgi:hypothetical protein